MDIARVCHGLDYGAGIHLVADWMWLSTSNRDKLYEDLGKFRNDRKMLDLINTKIYSISIISKRANGLDNVRTREILSMPSD